MNERPVDSPPAFFVSGTVLSFIRLCDVCVTPSTAGKMNYRLFVTTKRTRITDQPGFAAGMPR